MASSCRSCGNIYMADSLFCRHCGQRRDQAATQPIMAMAPQPLQTAAAAFRPAPQPGMQAAPVRPPLVEIRHPAPEALATAAAQAQSAAMPRHCAMSDRDISRRRRLRDAVQGAAPASAEANSENEEWYNTLMSRLRRLGDQQPQACRPSQVSRLDEGSGEASALTEQLSSSLASRRSGGAGGRGERPNTSGSNARSSSRDALNAKLRELGIDRQERPMAAQAPLPTSSRGIPLTSGTCAGMLSELPERNMRRDCHMGVGSSAHSWRRGEELLY